ncbi:MAG: tetratricopeptide repeat protein [Synechococcales bacterium]|nr:tetratricopeptide repeat protein [Synechococcales bacterium]
MFTFVSPTNRKFRRIHRYRLDRHRLFLGHQGSILLLRSRRGKQPRLNTLRSSTHLSFKEEDFRDGGNLHWLEIADRDRLLRQQALFAAQRGQYTIAISGLNCLIERNQESAADYNNRGLVHFQCGNWADALADYNYAIRLDPNLANVYNNRANYYAAQGDLFAAITDYQTAIELDPQNVRAWINQGITFRELEMHSPAIDNFIQALEINSSDPDVSNQVLLEAHIHAECGRTHHLFGDWNCAINSYYQALDCLQHESQTTTYPPLWWQVDTWLNELLQPTVERRD